MKIAVLVLQGMGKPNLPFYARLEKNLRRYFSEPINAKIEFFPVNYQASFQDEQTKLWERIIKRYKRKIKQRTIRHFLLDYFSDSVTYESDKDDTGGVYQCVHLEINNVLNTALNYAGDKGVLIVITYSLGCQIFSNYTYDLLESLKGNLKGIWKNQPLPNIDFLKFKTLIYWFSCGCNIPLFVSGKKKIEAIEKPNQHFKWLNYFDKNDALGWPLQALSKTGVNGVVNGYNELVDDIQINVGWWLMSHVRYWKRMAFIKRVAAKINDL